LTNGDGEPQPPPIAALFQGMVYDPDSGLYLARRRPYRADLGTFLAPEPLGPFVAAHPYAYALDDPGSYRELDGAQAESVSGTADMENVSRLEQAGAAAWDPLTGGLNDVGDQIGNRSDASQRTADGSEAGPDVGPFGSPSQEELPTPPASTRDTEREAREQWEREYRRREVERREAERQAALERFKAGVEQARAALPEEVARQWLPTDTRFGFGRFAEVEAADMFGADGPRGPAPIGQRRDPHALIREVLRAPLPEHDPANAERIRSVYHAILSEPETGLAVAAPTPAGETRSAPEALTMPAPEPTPEAPAASEHVLRADGVEIGVEDGRVQPAPQAPPRPPGGLSGLLGG
jgi:RHS repeat-associated protein